MLKKFTLRNYKNFKNEISIDFENIAGYQFNMDCLYEGTIGKMLIYGRNATGKTNLGNALLDIVATMFGRRRYTRNEVFLNADSTENVATFSYEFEFNGTDVSYKYSRVSDEKLQDEALFVNGIRIFFCDFSKENYNFDNLNYIEAETINVERYLQSSGIDDDIEISNTKIPFLRWLLSNAVFKNDSVLISLSNYVENLENLCYKNDFTNIILVFDYERHDPQFSADKILRLQNYFSDAADMGKLYLNYPMIESYQHLKSLPDEEYINRKISVSLQPGSKYKELVRNESVIEKAVDFPHRIEDLLAGTRYRIEDADKRQICCDKILNISNDSEMERSLEEILRVVDDDKKARTLKYQLKDWIEKVGYTHENRTYWKHMREVIGEIVCHNIEKAYVIQHEDRNDSNDRKLKEQFEQVDLSQILNVQNEVSQDMENGFIWVLNTCIFLIPDYNFRLIA